MNGIKKGIDGRRQLRFFQPANLTYPTHRMLHSCERIVGDREVRELSRIAICHQFPRVGVCAQGVEVGVFLVAEVGYDGWVEVVLLLVQLVLKIAEDQVSADRVFNRVGVDPAEVVVQVVLGSLPILVGDGLEQPAAAGLFGVVRTRKP